MSFDKRIQKIHELSQALRKNKGKIVDLAVRDLCFTVKDNAKEVDLAADRLLMFDEVTDSLKERLPLGGTGSRVSLVLSYNGSAWVNTAITSIFVVGNKVTVKFSSKAPHVMALTESMYQPIFGRDVVFYKGSGKTFLEESLRSPEVSTVVVFGFDANVKPYQAAFEKTGKKLVFEGPGQDPFIVFPDADLGLALDDLMASKFAYAGQTCTAPKRIFIHQSIYEEFLARFVERVKRLVVGDPADTKTDVSAVASDLAVRRLRTQLKEATQEGGEILTGGRIEGNLVWPTVVKNCTDEMLGMKEEVFGPVAFTTTFLTGEEVIGRARNHKYGLRAAVHGGEQAQKAAAALRGEPYCHPVPDYTFGKFGTVSCNEPRSASWKGAFIVKAVGGYGYSGWIWETSEGRFQIKQGPKLLSLETSEAA
ncbi:MAG: aldehyde dehydrogenase family protein [Acidobacteriia bacterium]|nr:aldehyde dehydrogenase family protein [Terriglobia bacterium]